MNCIEFQGKEEADELKIFFAIKESESDDYSKRFSSFKLFPSSWLRIKLSLIPAKVKKCENVSDVSKNEAALSSIVHSFNSS